MGTKNNITRRWVCCGAIVVVILGALIHFVFPWTNESRIIGAIAPVNESVWEHLKMGYLALALFSIFEYLRIKKHANNYFIAKLAGIITLELTIVIIFYSYTFFTGENYLWIDISSYVAGVFICQYLTHKIFRCKPFSVWINRLGLIGFLIIGILFGIFTYHPPHHEIFRDSNTNTYGIERKN